MDRPGTKHRHYVEESVAAGTLKLESANMRALDAALDPAKISGKRYADWILATVDR